MHFSLRNGKPLLAATPSAALHLTPVLYSDAERNTKGALWHEIFARLTLLRELDHLDDSRDHRADIGAAVAAVMMAIAVTTKDCSGVCAPMVWQHRGPDATLGDLRHAFDRLSVNAGKLSQHARAITLSPSAAQQYAAAQACIALCRESIVNGDERGDLRTLASKIAKNAARHGTPVDDEKEAA